MKLFPLTFLLLSVQQVFSQEHYMLVGTYDSPRSEGVYVFKFNSKDGTSKEISHVKASNPSFITLSPNEKFVYAVHETAPQDGKGGDVAVFSFDKLSGSLSFINKQASGGDHPCHVETDKTGQWLFASNYTSGSLSVLPINADGGLGKATVIQHTGAGKHPQRQKGPHVHGAVVTADNSQVLVTDLGIDKVLIYSLDANSGKLVAGEQPFSASVPGAGPRLMTFHPNNKYAYLVEELSGTVVFFKYKKGKLEAKQRISTMVAGDTLAPNSAFVQTSPDGKFLYASNRGDVNSIAIYSINKKGKLNTLEHQSTLGRTPRNFSIDPSGNYLLCENQNSDEIVVFKRDKKTGLLTDSGNRIKVGKPVCIKWASVN
jgi:6-phosphogluconolactonase